MPVGELVIQTVAMPANTNFYGDIFGGWLVSQMDLGGSVMAHRYAHDRMVTVSISDLSFIKPVYIGDIVCCYTEVINKGTTSISVAIDVWVERSKDSSTLQVAQGVFKYVCIDKAGKSIPIKWGNNS